MNALAASQLAEVELQLCSLVHHGWLEAIEADCLSDVANDERFEGFRVALSRQLIDVHKLPPLEHEMFPHDWAYSVVGGHKAVHALGCQLATYLMSTWVQRAITGEQARALCAQLGKEAYEHALRHEKPLRLWATPGVVPVDAVQFLAEKSQELLDDLWFCNAPKLTQWAALMSAPQGSITDEAGDFSPYDRPGQTRSSHQLLEEINQRLQVDFSIDVAAVFKTSAQPALH